MPNYLWRIKVIINSSIVRYTKRPTGLREIGRRCVKIYSTRGFSGNCSVYLPRSRALLPSRIIYYRLCDAYFFNVREPSRSYRIMLNAWECNWWEIASRKIEETANLPDLFFFCKSHLLPQTSNRIFFNRARL